MSATDTLEQGIARFIFGLGSPYSPPASFFVALFTAAPSDAGGGTEIPIGQNAYQRVQVTNDGTTWQLTGSTLISNIIPVTFAAPSPAANGTVTHFGLCRASTGSNLEFWAALQNARATQVGQPLTFAAGELQILID